MSPKVVTPCTGISCYSMSCMGFSSYAVVKVAGAAPEAFFLLLHYGRRAAAEPEMLSSKFMSEVQIRAQLRDMFQDNNHIEQLLKSARENPR
jgi:hypothetical protein